MILLCVATAVEARACGAGLRHSAQAARFEILQSGMGLVGAERALRRRLADRNQPRPAWIVSTGYAGSLGPGLQPGEWVWGTDVSLEGARSSALALDPPPFEGLACQRGSFLTVTEPTLVPSQSARLVDMESYAWASVTREHSLPFSIYRLVSDTPEAPLPASVAKLAGACVEGTGWATRAAHLVNGVTRAASEPRVLGRFLLRSSKLPGQLSKGWARVGEAGINGAYCLNGPAVLSGRQQDQ